jgi:hypothetical protein
VEQGGLSAKDASLVEYGMFRLLKMMDSDWREDPFAQMFFQ